MYQKYLSNSHDKKTCLQNDITVTKKFASNSKTVTSLGTKAHLKIQNLVF